MSTNRGFLERGGHNLGTLNASFGFGPNVFGVVVVKTPITPLAGTLALIISVAGVIPGDTALSGAVAAPVGVSGALSTEQALVGTVDEEAALKGELELDC